MVSDFIEVVNDENFEELKTIVTKFNDLDVDFVLDDDEFSGTLQFIELLKVITNEYKMTRMALGVLVSAANG